MVRLRSFCPLFAIRLVLAGLVFVGRRLLEGLGTGTIGFLIIQYPETSLSFGRTLDIEISRLAISTVMSPRRLPTVIVALGVLPSLTSFTGNSVTVIILKGADAFDGVHFVFFCWNQVRDGAVRRRGIQRSGDRIRFRGRMRAGGLFHTRAVHILRKRGMDKLLTSETKTQPE